jgi:hypothetical protein
MADEKNGNRLHELIEERDGRLSSSRLAYLLVTLTLCAIAVSMEVHGRTDATILGIVAAMGAGVYGFNKQSEASVQKTEIVNKVGG